LRFENFKFLLCTSKKKKIILLLLLRLFEKKKMLKTWSSCDHGGTMTWRRQCQKFENTGVLFYLAGTIRTSCASLCNTLLWSQESKMCVHKYHDDVVCACLFLRKNWYRMNRRLRRDYHMDNKFWKMDRFSMWDNTQIVSREMSSWKKIKFEITFCYLLLYMYKWNYCCCRCCTIFDMFIVF